MLRTPFLRIMPPPVYHYGPPQTDENSAATPISTADLTTVEREVRSAVRAWVGADLLAASRSFAALVNDVVSHWWRREARKDALILFGDLVVLAASSPAHTDSLRRFLANPEYLAITADQMNILQCVAAGLPEEEFPLDDDDVDDAES